MHLYPANNTFWQGTGITLSASASVALWAQQTTGVVLLSGDFDLHGKRIKIDERRLGQTGILGVCIFSTAVYVLRTRLLLLLSSSYDSTMDDILFYCSEHERPKGYPFFDYIM